MRFEIRALADGRISTVMVDAVSRDDALQQALARSLRPISVKEVTTRLARLGGSNHSYDSLLFAQELLALLEAGLNLIEAVDTLRERERVTTARRVLAQLSNRLREGKSCSAALDTLPEIFPSLFVGMVRAAERTGNLPEALKRYIEYRHRVDGLRNKVVSAAIYPVLLVLVALAVTAFLGGYVVPRFSAVYKGTGRPLPWASQLLLEWGSFVSDHGASVLLMVFLIVAGLVLWIRALSRHGGLARVIHVVPGIAKQAKVYELSRLYLTVGMLLDSGLAIMPALDLAKSAFPFSLRAAVQEAGTAIRAGERLSTAFEKAGLITPVGMRMLRVGEESGRLGELMTRAARFHDEETNRWIDRFSRVAEPTLMVLIGLVIGTIVVLLYMPIFDLAGSLR